MENKNKKCSLLEHKETLASTFCQKCNIFMCNKCETFHSKIFPSHNLIKLDKNIEDIFTGFCKEQGHLEKIEFFCKNHNVLCCSSCIIKIKRNGKGQHSNCTICNIEDIKQEKKNKFKDNLSLLENLSKRLLNEIQELKNIFEKSNLKKEELIKNIQIIFTKIRNSLNEREDELLMEVEKKYDELYINESLIKDSEKLPNRINYLIEKGKSIDINFKNEQNLSSIINDFINIENEIEKINNIEKKIKQCKESQNKEIKFGPEEEKKIDELKNQFISIITDMKSYTPTKEEKKILDILNNFRKNPKSFIDNKRSLRRRDYAEYEKYLNSLEAMNEFQIDEELINIAKGEVKEFSEDDDYIKYQIGEELSIELSERFDREHSALIALEYFDNNESLIPKLIFNGSDKEKKGRGIISNMIYTHIGFNRIENDEGIFMVLIFCPIKK